MCKELIIPTPAPYISLLHVSKETMANKIFHEEKQGLQGGKCIALSNPNAVGYPRKVNLTILLASLYKCLSNHEIVSNLCFEIRKNPLLPKERKDFIGKDKGLYTVCKVNSTL